MIVKDRENDTKSCDLLWKRRAV